jgi:hypothetical protein
MTEIVLSSLALLLTTLLLVTLDDCPIEMDGSEAPLGIELLLPLPLLLTPFGLSVEDLR